VTKKYKDLDGVTITCTWVWYGLLTIATCVVKRPVRWPLFCHRRAKLWNSLP